MAGGVTAASRKDSEMAELEVSFTHGEKYYYVDPCPFCGQDNGEFGEGKFIYVECPKCGARGPMMITYDGAANSWNKRK